jgi:hypothetical protein
VACHHGTATYIKRNLLAEKKERTEENVGLKEDTFQQRQSWAKTKLKPTEEEEPTRRFG